MAEGKPDPFKELANANTGLYRANSVDRLEFLPQLRGRKRAELYAEMLNNDALIGGIMFAIEMILRRVEWEAEPATGDEDEPDQYHMDRADFLASCMTDLSMTWEEVVALALSMLGHGFSYLEVVYKKRETTDLEAEAWRRTKFPDGKIGWRKFVLVPQETVEDWDLDDHGGVRAAIQGGSFGANRVTIPIEKAVLFRTTTTAPTGKSILRNVVEAWYYRKRIREIEGIGVERDLAGLPVFYLDAEIIANQTKADEYKTIVRNLRRDEQEGVLLPAARADNGELQPLAKLVLLSSDGSRRQFNTSEIIQRYSREITMSVLQDVLLLGHEKVGTQALASEKRDLSDTALQAWLNDIAAVLNAHAVPRLFALNGESLEDLPKLKPGELRPTDVAEFAEALKSIAGGGFVFSDDPEVDAEVRRRLGLPQRSPDQPLEPEPVEPVEPDEE